MVAPVSTAFVICASIRSAAASEDSGAIPSAISGYGGQLGVLVMIRLSTPKCWLGE